MLPVYVSYFAGGNKSAKVAKAGTAESTKTILSDKTAGDDKTGEGDIAASKDKAAGSALLNAIGFVLGFTIIFVALGAFAGSIGRLLLVHGTAVNIVTGLIVVIFGLRYLGVFNLGVFRMFPQKSQDASQTNEANSTNGSGNTSDASKGNNSSVIRSYPISHRISASRRRFGVVDKPLRFPSAIVFGAVFSIGWTPCVSAFLGAALMRASQQGSMAEGMLMLFVYSMGLGLPFIVSAVLIHRLKGTFAFIQRHYRVINAFAGGLLILVGILMMTGHFGRFMSLFS